MSVHTVRKVAVAAAVMLAMTGLSSCTTGPPDELRGTSWEWDGPPGADFQPHRLTFWDDEMFGVYAGCNGLTFTWAGGGGDDIDIDFHGQTEIGCDETLLAVDEHLTELFPTTQSVDRPAPDVLIFEFADGTTHTYSPTAATPAP